MSQNIYDDPDFFKEYLKYDRQKLGLVGAPEWPSVQAILPDLKGKRVIDLGCGLGWFCRYAIEYGAKSVLGIDISEAMLAKAQSFPTDSAIEYQLADLEDLELPSSLYDFAFSSLAFHYVADFTRLINVVYNSLQSKSSFIFTIEHPIYMSSLSRHLLTDEKGSKFWPVSKYAIEGQRNIDWLDHKVVKYHRTIGTTLNTLINVGFTILHVEEWKPTEEQLAEHPELEKELERPIFLTIKAFKA